MIFGPLLVTVHCHIFEVHNTTTRSLQTSYAITKSSLYIWFDHSSFLSLEIENENRLME